MNLTQTAAIGSSSEERMVVLNLLKDGKTSVEDTLRLISTLDKSPHSHGPLTFIDATVRFYSDGQWLPAHAQVSISWLNGDKYVPLPVEVLRIYYLCVMLICVTGWPKRCNEDAH